MGKPEVREVSNRWIRYELQMALLDGVFLSQKKMVQAATDLQLRCIESCYDWHDENHTYANAIHLRIQAPCGLGVEAETILFAILYLIEQQGSPLFSGVQSGTDCLLQPTSHARQKTMGSVQTTRYTLLNVAGMGDSRQAYQQLDRYLQLLSQVRISHYNTITGWQGSDWLLQHQRLSPADHFLIQINWRLTGSIFGPYLYAFVNLDERDHLHTNGAKTLHRWLSAHVWPGKTRQVLLPTLVSHVWPNEAKTASADRVRRHRMRGEILPDLNQLATWSVALGTKDRVTITRDARERRHSSESGWSSALPDPIAGLSPSPHPSSNAKALALPGRVETQPLWTRLDSVEAHRAWLAQQWQAVHTQIVIVSAYLSSRAIMADGIDEAIRQARQRGVSVMVYYDHQWALEHPKSGEAVRVLAHAGAVVQSLSRSHAKIVLVDQAAIAEGSFNWLSAERTRPDHMRWDTTVVCRDPALVGPWSQQILTQIKVLTA